MMDERDQMIDDWVGERRGLDAGEGFTRAVMRELPREGRGDQGRPMVPAWVPRPALASFCMVGGMAKALLVLQLALLN